MGFLAYISHVSADALPDAPGFQAHPLYLALSVLAPLVFGLLVSQILRILEMALDAGFHWGEH